MDKTRYVKTFEQFIESEETNEGVRPAYKSFIKAAKAAGVKTEDELYDILYSPEAEEWNISGGEYEVAKKQLKIKESVVIIPVTEGKLFTKFTWQKLSDDEKLEKLLSAVDDSDAAEDMINMKFDNLPSEITSNMYEGFIIEGKYDSFIKDASVKREGKYATIRFDIDDVDGWPGEATDDLMDVGDGSNKELEKGIMKAFKKAGLDADLQSKDVQFKQPGTGEFYGVWVPLK